MGTPHNFSHVPIIDVGGLVAGGPVPRPVAEALGAACRLSGFFYAVGHGVDPARGKFRRGQRLVRERRRPSQSRAGGVRPPEPDPPLAGAAGHAVAMAPGRRGTSG